MHTVYTFGYSGKQVAQLQEVAERLDAIVVDARYSPYSRDKSWNLQNLRRVLAERYVWMKEFGNVLYQTQDIQLNQPEIGLQRVKPLLERGPIILLCMCWDARTCHRQTVATLISEAYGNPIHWLMSKDLIPAGGKPKSVQQDLPF